MIELSRRRALATARCAAVAVFIGLLQVQPSVAAAVAITTTSVPDDPSALGGYDVLIADRGNNRLLLVSPEKQVLWEYDFAHLSANEGADDAFFADNGRQVVVNLEHGQVIEAIDLRSKQVTWSYGTLGRRGHAAGLLDFPDDAYKLPNGDIIVADIRNCRILEIAQDGSIVRQAGRTDRCGSSPGELASPNGDTPLADGGMLISTIRDHSLIRLDPAWQQQSRLTLPLHYPSDPQLTADGNYVIADYVRHGRIIEIDPHGTILWDFDASGQGGLNHPSLAEELPNGNIIANDDLNQRVIVVDKTTRKIVWQYGQTGRRGAGPDQLHIPDGLDIIRKECVQWTGYECRLHGPWRLWQSSASVADLPLSGQPTPPPAL